MLEGPWALLQHRGGSGKSNPAAQPFLPLQARLGRGPAVTQA